MPTSEYTPTVDQLGAFMRARTQTRFGQEVGTFDETTRPTAEQAQNLIEEAINEVAIAVGADLPAGPEGSEGLYTDGARSLVLILASMNVELTYQPEQTNDERSAYKALERRYDRFRKALIEAVTEAKGDASEDGGESAINDPTPLPRGTFPDARGTTLTERF